MKRKTRIIATTDVTGKLLRRMKFKPTGKWHDEYQLNDPPIRVFVGPAGLAVTNHETGNSRFVPIRKVGQMQKAVFDLCGEYLNT